MKLYIIASRLILITFIVSFLDINRVSALKVDLNALKVQFTQQQFQKIITDLSPHQADLEKPALVYLGKSYGAIKNSGAALKVFAIGLAKYPTDVEIKSLYGYELYRSKKDKEAIVTLKEAIEMNKGYEPSYAYLIEIFEKKKNSYELRLLYQDLLENVGEKFEYLLKLCENSQLAGLHDLVKKYCGRCSEVQPRKADCAVFLGLSQKDAGNIDQATIVLKKTADAFSKSDFAQVSYGQLLAEQKSFVDAYKYFQRAVKANSKSINGLVGIGTSGVEIQRLESALNAFKQACRLDRSTVPAFRKALTSLRQTQNKAWESQFENALNGCP